MNDNSAPCPSPLIPATGSYSLFSVPFFELQKEPTSKAVYPLWAQLELPLRSLLNFKNTYVFFGGPTRSHVLFGSWVGGNGVSPGSMVT